MYPRIMSATGREPNGRWKADPEPDMDEALAVVVELAEVLMAEGGPDALRSTEEREVVGWRPIETAPRDATRVLVLTPGSRLQVREAWWRVPYEAAPLKHGWWCYHGDKTLLCTHAHETDKGATHWMPLPDPPSTEGET